ncbi:MAG TPA: class IV adenylate cyclase [Candidatus Thermoplasmatota archaeon]|nr:class IV adenylate cyclase [Candidatus Thermoplasmatota archaeon]
MLEFEVKAPVPKARVEAVREALGDPDAVEEHEDVYFRHPSRDFARTDEALRLSRRADRVEIAYKGPKIDGTTKTRTEILLRVHDERDARALLESLGFSEVAVVRKRRQIHLTGGFEVCFDEVPTLGAFVEVERIVHSTEDLAAAEKEARALLASWGLSRTERRSYLELVMAQRSSTT